MKKFYAMVLNDTDVKEFRETVVDKGLTEGDTVFLFEKRPNMMDVLQIDSQDPERTKYKHILLINKWENGKIEIIEYVSSFGETFSNFEGF